MKRLDNSYRGCVVCKRGRLQDVLEDYLSILERHAPHDTVTAIAMDEVRSTLQSKDEENALRLIDDALPAVMQRIAPLGTVFAETSDGMKFVELSYDLKMCLTYEQYEYLKFALETSLIGAARMPRKAKSLEFLKVLVDNAMEVAYGAVHKEA